MDADFDALARTAAETSGAIEAMDRLWGATFALPEWHFIARGGVPAVRPYIASNAHFAGGRAMVRAFTDTARAARFAKENGLTGPAGDTQILSVPTKGVVEWLAGLIELGAWGVWFNSDAGSEGFFGPLAALARIRDRARDVAPAAPTRDAAREPSSLATAEALAQPGMSAASALIVGWGAALAELAAELLALRHAAPTGSAIDRAAAGCMDGCGAHGLVTEARSLLPAAPAPPTNAPELLLLAAHARGWIATNLESASVVGRAARVGLAGGELVRASTLLLAVHDPAWIPHLRFDPLERSAAAARDGGTQLALATGYGTLPAPLAGIAAALREPLTRLAARCAPPELRARHGDAAAVARAAIPLPWSAEVRAALTALGADGGPASTLGPLPPGASPPAAPVVARAQSLSLREVLAGFGAGRVPVDGVLRALVEHDGWIVHASHAIDPSAIVDGRVAVRAPVLLLGVDDRAPSTEAWIFTDEEGALAAQRAAGSLGAHLRNQRGVEVLPRLAARDDIARIRVNPGSPPELGFVIGRDAFAVMGMMCTAIAFERLAATSVAGDAAVGTAFLALPGVATLRRRADQALHTITGTATAPLARAAIGFTTPDVARAYLEHLPVEVREALEQVVPQPRTLAEAALDQAGARGLVVNPDGPGRVVLGRDALRPIVGRDAAPPRSIRWRHVFTDRARRFALDVDEETGRTYVSFPVRSSRAEYEEYYAVDRETFTRYEADPSLAHELVARAKRRELDHLLLFPPGSERGVPDDVPAARPRVTRA